MKQGSSACLSVCLSIGLSIYLHQSLSSVRLLSVCLYIRPSVCLSIHLYLPVCLYLSVCLSIALCLSLGPKEGREGWGDLGDYLTRSSVSSLPPAPRARPPAPLCTPHGITGQQRDTLLSERTSNDRTRSLWRNPQKWRFPEMELAHGRGASAHSMHS